MNMSLEQVGFLVPIMALVVAVVMGIWALLVSVVALVTAVVMNLFRPHAKSYGERPHPAGALEPRVDSEPGLQAVPVTLQRRP